MKNDRDTDNIGYIRQQDEDKQNKTQYRNLKR